MPFKANAAQRYHIPKQRHRVTNSAAYDAALRQRGSLTVWFTDEALAGAYDQDGVYGEVAKCSPDAPVIVPPRSSAVPSETARAALAPATDLVGCGRLT